MTLHANQVNRQTGTAEDYAWLSPDELNRIAVKLDAERKLTLSERQTVVTVLRRVRNAQNEWAYVMAPEFRGNRGVSLVAALRRLLNR
jgi:hypothetical protein